MARGMLILDEGAADSEEEGAEEDADVGVGVSDPVTTVETDAAIVRIVVKVNQMINPPLRVVTKVINIDKVFIIIKTYFRRLLLSNSWQWCYPRLESLLSKS